MSESKTKSSAELYLGLALGHVYVALALTALVIGMQRHWPTEWLAIAELGLLVFFLVGLVFLKFMAAALASVANMKAVRYVADRIQQKPAAGAAASAGQPGLDVKAQSQSLRETLRAHLGWRWRYRQPWLLLTGNETAIARLLPGLVATGWLLTDNGLLLWSGGQNGQPDADWLKRLYKLRRRRPVDAVVAVTDGEIDLPNQQRGAHPYGIGLARIAKALRWSAPVYVLDVAGTNAAGSNNSLVIACEWPNQADAAAIERALQSLSHRLAQRGMHQLTHGDRNTYLAKLSQQLDARAQALVDWTAGLSARHRWAIPIRGLAFAPYPSGAGSQPERQDSADLPHWRYFGEAARRRPGKRIGWHPMSVCAGVALVSIGLWTAGMAASGLRNHQDLSETRQAIQAVQTATNPAMRLRALLALQQEIERYETRTQHHAPLLTRFGLNRDAEVLAALWEPYAKASHELLTMPVQQNLEASLVDLGQLQTTTLDDKTSQWALAGHDGLKAYLMLATPGRADPAFLAKRLAQDWPTDARITPGEKQDLAERLFKFYAQHLPAHPDWKIEARPELVAGARQTLLAVIGQRNAQDTLYQGILNGAGNKYPDLKLPALTAGTEARGLLRSTAVVPGVFTRQAYEGYVEDAIEAAAKRRDVSTDWVLAGGKAATAAPENSADELRAALTEQYFADYAQHWQDFMNSLHWESAPTLPAAIDQLKLLADARQSPVIALMKSLAYQGGAGVPKASLSDTLMNKAKDVLGKQDDAPDASNAAPASPLDAAFGPVLRLIGQSGRAGQGGSSDLNLQRYLDRTTALRLHLQQVNTGADAEEQARQMAQALFQGKSSDLADVRAYAQLVAASLGAEWAGMGDTLFVRPIVQATQTIVLPAQASLNEAWQRFVVMDWEQTFAGRYPFANTANDASLPKFAQFMRPQGGIIPTFLATQLAGVLELQGNQWVPAAGAHGVTFDPQFIKFINTLQRVASNLLVQGEPQYHFEIKAIPTAELIDTVLNIDGQQLRYYNQSETWQRFSWPANNLQEPRTILQWQFLTAGSNKNYEYGGRFAFLRMLARGHVEQIDGATYQVSWPAAPDTRAAPDDPSAPSTRMPPMIRFLIRAEAGGGPLDMLALQGLTPPPRIFLVGRTALP
ncbi:ImcF-related family protein [Cupriavidus sp. WKF15]|uniref:ImcF-related family protein n=1 Tax=Cupriavidus sp. WKF15 TaxID=3032282 RepID=UPI0023E19B33|nr:ImcF-related family protein [Cupriavidus sp. WKF15]WER48213.1 ImcF-related family protein [Cupriavidus sp. WKF15]